MRPRKKNTNSELGKSLKDQHARINPTTLYIGLDGQEEYTDNNRDLITRINPQH